MQSIRAKKGYVGFVLSDEHKLLFRAELVKQVFEDMCTEGNVNYQATCAALMKDVNPDAATAAKMKRGGANTPKNGTQPQPSPEALPPTPQPKATSPLSSKRLEILNQLKALQGAGAVASTALATQADTDDAVIAAAAEP